MIPEYLDQVDAEWLSDALAVRRPGTFTPADGIRSEEYIATMGSVFATAIVDLDAFEAVRRPR